MSAQSPQAALSDTLRILIADDAAETRRTLRIMLSLDEQLEVVAIAENGFQAVELAELHEPDIALVDINMPGLNGIEAIKRMLTRHPDLICAVISTEQDSHTLYEAMAAGAREYLIKPFTVGELEQVIAKVRKLIDERNQLVEEATEIRKRRERELKALKTKARAHILARRIDDETVEVLEALSISPDCEDLWLMNLGMVYIMRKEWGKVRELAKRVEKK
ncbi:MAG: response regulator transcription factor [Anaerolineales bacterium]|jgi:YesN/AraC family two-component response regulator|nr:response regulator transcription factor [Anaerolineales bacterium]